MRWWVAFLCVVGCGELDLAEVLGTDDGPAFYSYERDGRTVFVSDPSLIPDDVEAAPFDVSHVSLNEELGAELDAAIEAEHERLVATDYCAEERSTAARSTLEQAWEEQPHWVGIGALVLMLLLTAPFVARRVGAPKWIRVLVLVIPLLLLLGVLTHTLNTATHSLSAARAVGALCQEDALANASQSEQLGIVRQLQQAYARRAARIDAVIESAR